MSDAQPPCPSLGRLSLAGAVLNARNQRLRLADPLCHIVFTSGLDPQVGLVASFNRPGGNATV